MRMRPWAPAIEHRQGGRRPSLLTMMAAAVNNNSTTIRGSFLASNNTSSSDDDRLPSAAAIAGLTAAAGRGGGGQGGYSYYDSFLLSSSRLAGAVAGAGDASDDDGGGAPEEEEGEEGEGGGGGLRHALGVIDRLQEQLRIVRRDKQALEERCYLLQRENAALLGAGHRQQAAAGHALSALSAAAEMKSLEQEVKEARQKIIVVEGELAAEREAGQAVRARLASAEAQLASRDALVGELRAKYEKGQETLRAAEQKHLEALERVFSESGAHAPGGLEGEEREQWRRELGEARREANTLREELLHRREEAGRLKDELRTVTQRKPRRPVTTARAEGEGGNEGERLRRLKEKYARRTEQLRLQERFTGALKKLLAKAKAEAEGARSRLALAVAESREMREELAAQTQRYEAVVARLRERLEGLVLAPTTADPVTAAAAGSKQRRKQQQQRRGGKGGRDQDATDAVVAAAAEAEEAETAERERRRQRREEKQRRRGGEGQEEGEGHRRRHHLHHDHRHEAGVGGAGGKGREKKTTTTTKKQAAETQGPMAWQITFPPYLAGEEARCRAKGKPAPYEASPVIERFKPEMRE